MKKLIIFLFALLITIGGCNAIQFSGETVVKGKVTINLKEIPEYQNSELTQAVVEYLTELIGQIQVENVIIDFEKGIVTVEYYKVLNAGE